MRRLKQGDSIGIFSPSSPITNTVPIRYKRAKKYLQRKGFKIVEGKLTGKADYYRSGSIKERAEELNDLIRNPNIQCIMSTIGGMNSNSILPYLDYNSFKKNPKIVIGYSDVTAVLLALYEQTGIPTFYGPALVSSFGEYPPFVDKTYEFFEDIMMNKIQIPYKFPKPKYWTDEFIDWSEQNRGKERKKNNWKTIFKGKARGRVIGGNLNTITGIWGSKYMPSIQEGDILFIEDSLKNAATIERSFSLLKINGVFDKVSGIILGKHELFDDQQTGREPYEILLEVLNNVEMPFIADFDCCHTHPMLTLPLGSTIELDATNQKITLMNDIFDY